MHREPKAYVWDALEAIKALETFIANRTQDDFEKDLLLRSAVERQLEIVGEALNQLARHDQAMADKIPDIRQIIAFRNILVHGYAVIDNERVWRILHESLPELQDVLEGLLGEGES
jgi:uncharacterized protein with HEPN domain